MPFPHRKLRRRREELGLSRPQLAAASGVMPRHLEKLEQGLNPNPTLDTLQALCTALGVGCDFFFGDDDAEGEPVPPGRPRKAAAEEPAPEPPTKAKRKPKG